MSLESGGEVAESSAAAATVKSPFAQGEDGEMDDEEFNRILADLSPL